MWAVNKVAGRNVFNTDYVNKIDKYMKSHGDVTLDELLKSGDIV